MLEIECSKYHMYMEWLLHKFFIHSRVMRTEIEDGKTEWFLVDAEELVLGVWKLCRALNIVFQDTAHLCMPESFKV